jgi:probable addiction module antidote protein
MTISRERKSKASAPASVPARPHLLAWLKSPKNAAAYIEVALTEGDSGDLLHALRDVAEARGGIARIAERTGLNREALYRTLSKRGNPQLKSLAAILSANGLRLSVRPETNQERRVA